MDKAKAYWYIVRNSFRENNQSPITLGVSLLQPIILTAGYFLFYNYITRNVHGGLSKEYIIYYLFIIVIATLDVPRFGSFIQGDIQTEKYLMIDKLPISPFLYYFWHSVGKSIVPLMLYTTAILILLIQMTVPLLTVVLFIPSAIVAFVLAHLLTFTMTMASFYDEQIHMWFFSILFEFLSGKMIPLALFPPVVSGVLTWGIPFGFAGGTLARFLSTENYISVCIGMVVGIMWIALLDKWVRTFWNKGSLYFQEHS